MGAAVVERLRRAKLGWVVAAAVLLSVVLVLGLAVLARRAEPMLRARVVAELAARFHSPVELDGLTVSLGRGLAVEGRGLRILYLAGPSRPDAHPEAGVPMIAVRRFGFRVGWRELFSPSVRSLTVEVDGTEAHIPPPPLPGTSRGDDAARRGLPLESVLVERLVLTGTRLVIETRAPGKVPLSFAIPRLVLTNVGRRQPMAFEAEVENPKPVGLVQATGHVGPWQNDNPRDTPVDGRYRLMDVDLGSIRGLGGKLSSTASFGGTLGALEVDGTAETPDLRLTVANHPMPFRATFHVLVDATTGETTLAPVRARLGSSPVTVTGAITRRPGVPGHHVALDAVVEDGRLEDFLSLAVRSAPAMMRGVLRSRMHLEVPPGPGTVTERLRLAGRFALAEGSFSNARLQRQVDELSERAAGRRDRRVTVEAPPVAATLSGSCAMAEERVRLADVAFTMPGATVQGKGEYGLDGRTLAFEGTARTEATASEMVGGWKGLLVMPFDRLVQRHGAGVELPFRLSGTPAEPRLALDFGHGMLELPLPGAR